MSSTSTTVKRKVKLVISNLSDESRKKIHDNFSDCVKGHHLINNDPIIGTHWEYLNAVVIVASGYKIYSQSNGSHNPGKDLSCSIGSFSNKTTKYKPGNTSFKVSSYRLTAACRGNDSEKIVEEIERRKNFKYYSILVRSEKKNESHYDWYLIPSDYPQFNPRSYIWTPKVGTRGKNKGSMVGWKTNTINGSSMSITYETSSELWINIVITEEMKTFIIGSCGVNTADKPINYIQLYQSFHNRESVR